MSGRFFSVLATETSLSLPNSKKRARFTGSSLRRLRTFGRLCLPALASRASTSAKDTSGIRSSHSAAPSRMALESTYMPPPSKPRFETTNSPRCFMPPARNSTCFTGAPNRGAICADQSTAKPMLAGLKRRNKIGHVCAAHAPSEPSRAQLAPPIAKTVTSGARLTRPSGVSNSASTDPAPARLELNA